MSRLGTALKATAVQQAFELVAMVLSLVLVPLYLLRLGAEGYGLFLLGVAWAGYLMFSSGGLSAATLILTSQAWAVNDREQVATILRTARGLTVLGALFVTAVSVGFHFVLGLPSVAQALKLTHPDAPMLALAVGAQVVVSLLSSPFYDTLIGVQRTHQVSFVQGVVRLLTQLLGLALLLARQPVWVVFCATPLCAAAGGVTAYVLTRRADGELIRNGPFLARGEVVRQVRTGAKSLGMQVGATLVFTAPLFALSAVGGPALVPLYAVPNRIIAVFSSALFNFTAYLQPAVGDAWARRDLDWLRDTTRMLIRQTAVIFGGVAAVMLAVGPALVAGWTADRLVVSPWMMAGLLLSASCLGLVATMKFILSGMNRHRAAALSELSSGAVAMLACWLLARFFSPDSVAFGVAVAALGTSLVIMPQQLRRYLEVSALLPSVRHWATLAVCMAVTWAAAAGALQLLSRLGAPMLLGCAVSGAVAAALFAVSCEVTGLIRVLGPLRAALERRLSSRPAAVQTKEEGRAS